MTAPIAGTRGGGTATDSKPAQPGDLFGVPKFSTQPRFVPDNGNESLAVTPLSGSQVTVKTTALDKLDIVRGLKINCAYNGTWTEGSGKTLTNSPFFPASIFSQITFKLQSAYATFNQTGPLASIIQAMRPMFGARQIGVTNPDEFAQSGQNDPVSGTASNLSMNIDIPFAVKFDTYYDLTAQGTASRKIRDAIVTPYEMAAMARVVMPTIVLGPQLGASDALGSPVAIASGDTTSTYTSSGATLAVNRVAWWSANSPLGNPPQYPWMYTRDYFEQPTAGQAKVGVLIQNTGISVGQVLSLYGFVWDPAANSGIGGIVPASAIDHYELVTGGSLQNEYSTPAQMRDIQRSLYGWGRGQAVDMPDGVFSFDRCLDMEGAGLSNAHAINTYIVNGVQVNIVFKSGSVPSAQSTVYMGVEALKLVTS